MRPPRRVWCGVSRAFLPNFLSVTTFPPIFSPLRTSPSERKPTALGDDVLRQDAPAADGGDGERTGDGAARGRGRSLGGDESPGALGPAARKL
jgi:hypothetical protein